MIYASQTRWEKGDSNQPRLRVATDVPFSLPLTFASFPAGVLLSILPHFRGVDVNKVGKAQSLSASSEFSLTLHKFPGFPLICLTVYFLPDFQTCGHPAYVISSAVNEDI